MFSGYPIIPDVFLSVFWGCSGGSPYFSGFSLCGSYKKINREPDNVRIWCKEIPEIRNSISVRTKYAYIFCFTPKSVFLWLFHLVYATGFAIIDLSRRCLFSVSIAFINKTYENQYASKHFLCMLSLKIKFERWSFSFRLRKKKLDKLVQNKKLVWKGTFLLLKWHRKNGPA